MIKSKIAKNEIAHSLGVRLNEHINFMANKMFSQVLDHLINLMQYDPLWEVKVEAINGKDKKGCSESNFC